VVWTSPTSPVGGLVVGGRRRSSGFTLMELLLVAAILGLAAAIAAPRVAAFAPRVHLGISARQVIDVVRLAQVTAANSGQRAYVAYDLTSEAARVLGSEPENDESRLSEYLSEGVCISAVRPSGQAEVTSGSARIVVFPGGYPWPHEVELRTAAGSHVTIRFRGLTASIDEGSQ